VSIRSDLIDRLQELLLSQLDVLRSFPQLPYHRVVLLCDGLVLQPLLHILLNALYQALVEFIFKLLDLFRLFRRTKSACTLALCFQYVLCPHAQELLDDIDLIKVLEVLFSVLLLFQ